MVATTLGGIYSGHYTLTVRNLTASPAKAIANFKDKLGPNDAVDAARKVPSRVHTVAMKAGKSYKIDLISTDFDAHLRLESPKGNHIQEDDDSGGNLNSRIEYTATENGEFRLVAMPYVSLNGNDGAYTLRVTEKE